MSARAPIFVISRFRSGSSFLWNLFRKDPRYCCYYEPFHDNLAELVEINRPAMESHRGITSYWDEYRNVAGDLGAIHRPQFGISDLFLRPGDKRPELVQFIQHLMRSAAREGRTCLIKCNRFDFRLPWLRASFPDAKIIYILRNPRDQWISSVRPHKPELWDRLEENIGYDLPAWIASLAPHWPFLLEGPPRPAYYYSYLLWKLSREFGERYADVTLDFDRDVADEPANLAENLAPFFPAGFFKQPDVQALIKPTRPGIWRKFRTEEWFNELELQSEHTLKQAGVYKPTFWRWPAATKAAGREHDGELRRAIDLALLMFSRHRADLLVHGHQLQISLDSAKKHAESLSDAYEKSRDTLKTTESQRSELDSKHRLLQAVYDSLKQAHDISITSLSKSLEEFQYATKELHQLIAYKDAQLLQLTDRTAEIQKTLTDTKSQDRLDGVTGQLAEARKIEQTLRHELENSRIGLVQLEGTSKAELAEARAAIDQLRGELTGAKSEAHEAKMLKNHAMALEASSAETWTALAAARKELTADEVLRGQIEARLQAKEAELNVLHENERAANQKLLAATGRAEDLSRTIAARDETIKEHQLDTLTLQNTVKGKADEAVILRSQLAQESSEKAALRAELAGARTELDAVKAHVSTLELAQDEGRRLIVELRTQLAGFAARCETLERESTTKDTALAAREEQFAALSDRTRELEGQLAHLGRELESRLAALDAAQAAGRQLTEDLARARHRIGALEEITATEARQLVELQSNLQASNETHENLARQNDKLSYELRTEQTARTTEKVAYDQRTTIHVGQLKEVHQLLDAAKAHLTTREADLQGRITILNEQLSAATARLAAIEQSWASGLIHRLAPAAFKPINPR